MEGEHVANFAVITAIVLVFILRIFGLITWPWIWILAPIWIPFGIGTILCIGLVITIIITELKERKNEFRD